MTSTDFTLNGFILGQGATVTETHGVYDTSNAGARTVTATLSADSITTNSGTNLSNYTLPILASGAGTINPRELLATITGNPTKTYDGSNAASLASSDYTLGGFVAGQGVTVTKATGSYASPDAGSRTITTALAFSDLTANNGTNLDNYILPTSASGAGTINPRSLSAYIVGDPTKIYDGANSATLLLSNYSLTGFVTGQSSTIIQAHGAYDAPDAGPRTVTAALAPGDFSPIVGTNLSNYILPTTAAGVAHITPKALDVTITGDPTKIYDGNTNATLASESYTLAGFITGQGASITQTSGAYDADHAGSHTLSVALSSNDFTANGSTNLANYVLPNSAHGSGTINPKALTAAISSDPTKVYDGTITATLASSDYALNGFIAGQGANVTKTSAIYDSANAGSRTLTTALAASDFATNGSTNLGNYVLPVSASGAGSITPKIVTASITGASSKTYDGTNTATLTVNDYSLSGFIAGQGANVTQTSGSYDSANAGARSVSAMLGQGNFTATGATDLANYHLPVTATGRATINPKVLSAAITGNPTKTYDGAVSAILAPGDYSLSGFVAGQSAAVTRNAGIYNTANAGSQNVSTTFTASDFTAGANTSLSNYVLPTAAFGAGTIKQKPLTATITGSPTKIYDDSNGATLGVDDYTLSGFIAGQGATVTRNDGAYDTADVGSRTVTAPLASTDFTANSGTNLANYVLPTFASGVGAIDTKPVTAGIAGNPTKIYDGAKAATLSPGDYTLIGFLAGQGATVTQINGVYDSSDAGTRSVTATLGSNAFTPNGNTKLSNYSLPATASGVATIVPKQLTVAIASNPTKTYDGITSASLTSGEYALAGFVGDQGATITQATGAYNLADAGARTVTTPLTATDFIPNSRTNLSNYVLPVNASGMGTINPKTLSIAITGNPTKTYEGNTAATLTSADYSLSGFVGGQAVVVTQTVGTFDSANAGLRNVLTRLSPSDYSPAAGTNLANYILPASASGTGAVNLRPITVSIIGVPTKVKDGSLTATLTVSNFLLSGFIPGQGATISQRTGAYNSADAGDRIVIALLASQNFSGIGDTSLSNYSLPTSAFGNGLIMPAILVNAPTLNDAIANNMAIRNLAPAPAIVAMTTQAVFAATVPRTYIPYPSPSMLSSWQNNGFGSLPTILGKNNVGSAALQSSDGAITSGPPVINTTEQILLQGGKDKSYVISPPDTVPDPLTSPRRKP